MSLKNRKAIRWLVAASEDLAQIISDIAADRPRAAERLAERILHRVELLADFPYLGSVCPSCNLQCRSVHLHDSALGRRRTCLVECSGLTERNRKPAILFRITAKRITYCLEMAGSILAKGWTAYAHSPVIAKRAL